MVVTVTAAPPALDAATAVPDFIGRWFAQLEPTSLSEAIPEPGKAGIFSADMIVGFCRRGNLASPRIDALTEPVVDLFQRAYDHGVRHFVLLQDSHDPTTPEFRAWPVHCLRGSDESETIPELVALPFSDRFTVIPKNSLGPGYATTFDDWLDAHADISTAVVVGDCTDLCTYNLAMHLRLRANARNIGAFDVIVPANAVDTYDLPAETASEIGAFAHPGDFFHQVFLYHLALNGMRVVRALT